MVTVWREDGFRVVIYRNEPAPPHVHVIRDGEVVINLLGADDQPEVRQAWVATKADVRQALQMVTRQREHLLAQWREIHG